MIYAIIKVIFLEAGNYGEHYGLQRKRGEDGLHESIAAKHSWNAVSSPMFFRIQRHSDHHGHVYRPYQVLRKFDLAPQLPYCYIGILILSLNPPLFFHVMDPRVKAIEDTANGIPNDDQWNDAQPMSAADKKRDFHA